MRVFLTYYFIGSYGDKCFYWRELSIPVVTVSLGFLRFVYVLDGHILVTRDGRKFNTNEMKQRDLLRYSAKSAQSH